MKQIIPKILIISVTSCIAVWGITAQAEGVDEVMHNYRIGLEKAMNQAEQERQNNAQEERQKYQKLQAQLKEDDQADTEESDQTATKEKESTPPKQKSEQTDQKVPTTECDCNDPRYDYPSNFYYNAQHQKIMRLYPQKCRCAPEGVSSGVVGKITDSQTGDNSTTSKTKKSIFDIHY